MVTIRTQISAAISALAFFILLGTLLFHRIESWTWIQSFYFTVTTITTVGYGDIHPTTDGSRLATAIFILAGVSVGITALGIIGKVYIDRRQSRSTS
jgi:voltage-gated potassium channel